MLRARRAMFKNPDDIPLNPDWFIGILIMPYDNPYITGKYLIPYTQLNNQGQLVTTS